MKLTMGTYTDSASLEVHEAIKSLPELKLSPVLPPLLPPKSCPNGQFLAKAVNMAVDVPPLENIEEIDVTSMPDNKKDSLTTGVNESQMSGRQDTVRTFCVWRRSLAKGFSLGR